MTIRRWQAAATAALICTTAHAAFAQRPGLETARAAAEARVTQAHAAFAEALVRRATPAGTGALRSAAAARLAALAAAMEDAPGAVLRAALSPAALAAIPPEVRDLVESRVDLAGTADVLYEIHRPWVALKHTLDTAQGRVSLHFDGEPPAWTSGVQVRVAGVRVGDDVAAAAGATTTTTTTTTAAAALPGVTGDQRTLMMLVNFADKVTEPYTVDYARSVLFSTTDGFMRENSAGTISFSGDVVGWVTIPLSSTVCDYNTLASQAQSAATAAGIDVGAYTRYAYAFPSNACTWWGLGSVGGSPSRAWVNGTLVLDVLGHEMGHNLGLYHSHNWDCGTEVLGATCTANEYGDTLDIMGSSKGHFNAFQKERLGWLSASQIATVTGGGTFTVEPYETATGGTKALKIFKGLDSSGRRTYYYVEFRQAVGYDAFLASWANVMNGVAVRMGTESNPGSSYLLDMTPATTSWSDPALMVGQSYTDAAAGVTIAVQSATSTGALVAVTMGSAACTRMTPSIAITPGSATVLAGTAVNYAAQITNNDTGSCASSTFALGGTAPAGWTATLPTTSVTLAAGASTSVPFTITAPAGTAAGSYGLTLRATDAAAARSAQGSATYVVRVPYAVTVTTDRATYVRGDTVTATARVTSGGVAAAGVSVTFQFRKADGRLTSATAVTSTAGVATARLSTKRRDPLGVYQVTVTAGDAAPATASFSVQ